MSALSSDDILLGLALVIVLAVGSQLLARRLGLPAIVVLLPAGFVAGIATDDVQPDKLLGALYQPFVSLAVGVILFEAGLRLTFREVAVGVHRVLVRLLAAGVLVTLVGVAATVALLFGDMDRGVPWLIGAILVVSGPTVVLPLLAFIRPTRNVRSLLKWEGTLVDPIGALLGVVVFHAVRAEWQPGDFLIGIGAGALVGVVAAVVLRLLLNELHLNAPRQAVPATLMVVVGSLVAADLLSDDAGFVATVLMGVALANQGRFDVSLTLEFQETLVQLLVGVLFVLIAASVSPSDVEGVLPEAIALLVVMVIVLRPLAVAIATARSTFTLRERAFVAWMAPRGIVAGATASAFGLQLAEKGIDGASSVLPIVFVVIFGTVLLYGLTGPLAARWLDVAGAGRGLVLVVGGHSWAREIAVALRRAGVDVRMWVGAPTDREAARAAGIDADRGRMMVDSVDREAELEDVSDVLLLTQSDDFNAVAASELRSELGHGHVFRISPDPEETDLLPPATEGGILGAQGLTFTELSSRFADGARIVVHPQQEPLGQTDVTLFTVSSNGRLSVAADGRAPDTQPGGRVIALVSG
jgi:NhaP-type Na+/H+ or K+/H+ antiporter